jgi:hypothetical protein
MSHGHITWASRKKIYHGLVLVLNWAILLKKVWSFSKLGTYHRKSRQRHTL